MRIIDADALFDSLIFPNDQWRKTFKELLDDEPTVDLSKCFEGMTNGEVLQAIISGLEPIVLSNETGAIYFDWEWWNAPYQKGGE